jgi:hypothetical protein
MKQLLLILFVISFACTANAQITIQYADWQNMMKVGKKVTGYSNQAGESVTVNIGTASASSQTFDLSNLSFTTAMSIEYVQPSSAPSISSFPTCNLVQKQNVTLGGSPFLNFAYFEFITSGFSACGYSDDSSTPYVSYPNPICNAQFPLTYGKKWSASFETQTVISKSVHKMGFKVDAFGKLKLPMGTYDALRICMIDTTSTTVNGSTTSKITVSIKYYTKNSEIVEIVADTKALTSSSISSSTVTYFIPSGASAISDQQNIPAGYRLNQNYPNPFNPVTTISFTLPKNEAVTLKIFDVNGKLIKTLLDKTQQPAGTHQLGWDGKDNNQRLVSSGVYFYNMQTSNYSEIKKCLLMK